MKRFAAIMSSFIGPAISAVGAFFGRRAAREQAKAQLGWEKHWAKNKISYTVADALRSGINPLTAIMGGAGYNGGFSTNVPSLSPASFFAEALADGVEAVQERKRIEEDREAEKLRQNERRQQVKQEREAQTKLIDQDFGYSIRRIASPGQFTDTGESVVVTQPKIAGGTRANSVVRPVARPTPATTDRIPVYHPSGTGGAIMVPKDIASRLGIEENFGNLMMGDWEELVGELPADVTGVKDVKEIHDNIGAPHMRQTRPDEVKRRQDNKNTTANPWWWMYEYGFDPLVPKT